MEQEIRVHMDIENFLKRQQLVGAACGWEVSGAFFSLY